MSVLDKHDAKIRKHYKYVHIYKIAGRLCAPLLPPWIMPAVSDTGLKTRLASTGASKLRPIIFRGHDVTWHLHILCTTHCRACVLY